MHVSTGKEPPGNLEEEPEITIVKLFVFISCIYKFFIKALIKNRHKYKSTLLYCMTEL